MRHSHHTAGSANAQADLAALAGWTPSRRGFLGGLLVASAATAAVATASAIVIPASAASPAGVSPRMAELIVMYEAVSANIDTLDPHTDHAAWTAAEQAWNVAEVALMNERPQTVCDFSAKFDALLQIDSSEGEFARLKRLSEDAAALGGCAK